MAPKTAGKRAAEGNGDIEKESPGSKSARRGTRSERKRENSSLSPRDLVAWCLVPENYIPLVYPTNEDRDKSNKGRLDPPSRDEWAYPGGRPWKGTSAGEKDHFSPFQQLVCAILLSKPISHRLGLRTIRTIFNEPFALTTPTKIKTAGWDKVNECMHEAHTLHKEKTATQIHGLSLALIEEHDSDEKMDAVRHPKGESESLDDAVRAFNGIGPTGIDLFYRGVQGQWTELYPFADKRALQGAKELGLPEDLKELAKVVEEATPKGAKKEETFALFVSILAALQIENKLETVREGASQK